MRSIFAGCVGLFSGIGEENRNVAGEFAKMFEKVVGVKVLEGDKRAVCDP